MKMPYDKDLLDVIAVLTMAITNMKLHSYGASHQGNNEYTSIRKKFILLKLHQ